MESPLGQISYSSIGGVSLINGIAHSSSSPWWLERHHPAATKGINMAMKGLERSVHEWLWEVLRWLTESHTLQVTIIGNNCYFQVSTEKGVCVHDHKYATDIQRVLCAIPLTPDLAKGKVHLLKKIRSHICSQWNWIADTIHSFVHPDYAHLCAEGTMATHNLETVVLQFPV